MWDTPAAERSALSCTFPQWVLVHIMDQSNDRSLSGSTTGNGGNGVLIGGNRQDCGTSSSYWSRTGAPDDGRI